jgi:hypothetical protein
MTGIPWELSPAPRQRYFGAPPLPRKRGGKQPATGTAALEPINEHHRQDAATSTTDLAGQLGAETGQGLSELGKGRQDGSVAPKMVKAPVNALARIVSAALGW